MGVYQFLAGLPAAIGVAGFFAYLWAGQARVGGDILKKIVDKLRADPNIDVKQYGTLTPSKLKALVATDGLVRHAVNDGDTAVLRLLVIFQYLLTGLMLLVCAALVGVSVWLYVRPEPFSLSQTGPTAIHPDAGGNLVDLDPISVAWTYAGPEETVSVFLENVDAGHRTKKRVVPANARSVQFDAADLTPLMVDRKYHGKNRVRAVLEWPGGTSYSAAKDLWVGIEIDLMLFGRSIGPGGEERDIHTLFATIDRSTETMPPDYRFKGDFVAKTAAGPLVIALESSNAEGEMQLRGLENVDWARPFGFVYNGPDDSHIVRTRVSGKAVPRSRSQDARDDANLNDESHTVLNRSSIPRGRTLRVVGGA